MQWCRLYVRPCRSHYHQDVCLLFEVPYSSRVKLPARFKGLRLLDALPAAHTSPITLVPVAHAVPFLGPFVNINPHLRRPILSPIRPLPSPGPDDLNENTILRIDKRQAPVYSLVGGYGKQSKS